MPYIGIEPKYGTFRADTFIGNGSTQTFTLTTQPQSVGAVIAAIDGVIQEPVAAYGIASNTITFTSAPPNGARIWVVTMGASLLTSNPLVSNFTLNGFTGTGTATTFPLTVGMGGLPSTAAGFLVAIQGVVQNPNSGAYTIAGNNIVFASPPALGEEIWVVQLGSPSEIGTPSDGTVDVPQLHANLLGLVRKHINGLTLSNGTDTDHDIDIAVGSAGEDGGDLLVLGTTLTKQIDAAWDVGTDEGGLDTGAVAGNTLYAVWLIKRSDTQVVDALFSTSFTAPTMPADYDEKRLIGAVCTDSSSNIIQFVQVGDYFRYTSEIIQDVSDSTLADATFETGVLSVPPNCLAHVYVSATTDDNSGIPAVVWVRYPSSAESTKQESMGAALIADSEFLSTNGFVLVDDSREIEYAAAEPSGDTTIDIRTHGFIMLTRSNP